MKLKSLLLSASLLFIVYTFSAQEVKKHEFIGKVLIEDSGAKDVTVKVYDRNKCFSRYTTKGSGKFFFTAGVEKHYTLEFEKEGYVTKRVVINTRNTKYLDKETKTYKFDLALLEKEEGKMYEAYDFPVAIIEIDPKNKEFRYNKEYTKSRKLAWELEEDNEMADR